jgi:hypothetical protein
VGSGTRSTQKHIKKKKKKKITAQKKINFFLVQKLQFTYPKASIKDAQATGEAFSPQKRTSSQCCGTVTIYYGSGSDF